MTLSVEARHSELRGGGDAVLRVFGARGRLFNLNALLFGSAAGSFAFAPLRMTGSNA